MISHPIHVSTVPPSTLAEASFILPKSAKGLDNEATESYFSQLAEREQVNAGANADKFARILPLFIPSSEAPSLAECGGGGGYYTARFLENGYHVTCVDLSEHALAVNSTNAARAGQEHRLETVKGDFVAFIDSTDARFDQIAFIKVLHHFESMASISAALEGALRNVKQGGRVIIFEPNGTNPVWRIALSIAKDKVTGRPKWYYEKNMEFTKVRLLRPIIDRAIAKHARGATVQVRYHYIIPAILMNRLKRLGPALQGLNRILEKTPLKFLLSANFSIVVEVPEESAPVG